MFNLAPVPVPDLAGKTILVTGAGRGIGATLSALLVEKGARVYAGHVGGGRVPDGATAVRLDVTDAQQVKDTIAHIGEESGKLDALVNNAGTISPIGRIDKIVTEEMRQTFDVNVLGVHRMTVAALPLLKASRGVVVNAGTGAATTPMEGWTAYCSSKAGTRMLTQLFDLELSEAGTRFFFIGIPPTDTAMQAEIREAGLNPISKIPQSELVDPAVPASVMAWLCGPDARSLEGAIHDVRDEFFKAMMPL